MLRYFLLLSLFLLPELGCAAKSSVNNLSDAQVGGSPKLSIEPTPYQRLQLSQSESRALDRSLPQSARQILEHADALEPTFFEDKPGEGGIEKRVEIRDAGSKSELLDALYAGMVAPVVENACFKPRHSVRATYEGETVELLICFECHNYRGSISGGKSFGGTINSRPEGMLNRLIQSQKD